MIKTLIRWIPPIQGYKLNTDGSSIGNLGKSGTAEQGLKLALIRGLMPLEINTDCQELISIIINDHPSYSNMFLDCKDLLRRLGSPPIQHSFRETNRVADALAREG
ncbi:hypothetical protein KY284_017753 [Solanum tuberosum]|nr:hypothetical protein KY284_017753 [Solanum tuberosum]